MTIQDLGSIGELVAAIATIATLVYLAIQIRANTTALRLESRGRLHAGGMTHASVIGGSPQAADVFTRGLGDYHGLAPAEATQFQFLFSMLVSTADEAHYSYELGLSDRDWHQSATGVLRLLKAPGGREFWRLNSATFSPGFQKFVNQHLSQSS